MKQFKLVVKSICSVLLLLAFSTGPAEAQTITEIIDRMGDRDGNIYRGPTGIAVDGYGNIYTVGTVSRNAFKITPGGVITEIIDVTGDGAGNPLLDPYGIAVDGSGNVYVSGRLSENAFKITPGGVITEIIDATGDGNGNPLSRPIGIAVDGSGNVYVTGNVSDNAFKITPGGVITEIIDATGDGAGNPLDNPHTIAVDGAGNVYVTGLNTSNAFKIAPSCRVITEIIEDLIDLIDEVEDLVTAGVLNQNQGTALTATLTAAIAQLSPPPNVTAAVNQLQAFILQVSAFITAGILSPAEGQPLIDAAQAIIDDIQCGLAKQAGEPVSLERVPYEYKVFQNYPNPFNPTTTIHYELPLEGFVTLKVFDVLGREVKTLIEGYRTEGRYEVEFDATNLPSGIYIYRLRAGSFVETKKMILMK